MKNDIKTLKINIKGIVQGVGFRPFVYNLALKKDLLGWVRNSSAGVEIEVTGDQKSLEEFISEIENSPPPLSQIDLIKTEWLDKKSFNDFNIEFSEDDPNSFIPVSPDISICDDCLNELFDQNDKRHRYPFINCTNCGPRFTIIKSIPYDRPFTTMSPFDLCEYCKDEYTDPTNRRFHAQPVACPDCGPEISLVINKSEVGKGENALQHARELIKNGMIIAVKGIGGYHLACDAFNERAVSTLRERKNRIDKAFAVMSLSIDKIQDYSIVGKIERKFLTSRERPIVILEQKADSNLASSISPGQKTVGVMLPYTPLHYLLLEDDGEFPDAVVMTSGNFAEEPIDINNEAAFDHLDSIADAFLTNDRDIYIRCDDSVFQPYSFGDNEMMRSIRRSRGFAPNPISLEWDLPPILAVGPELKNTFCLTRDKYAFVSHHIGNLENYETLSSFESAIEHYEALFRTKPELIAYDLHPDYLSTRYALDRSASNNIESIGIQHHHAHIVSCMAENQLPSDSKVLGFSFDGTGYGVDGTIWGGEVMLSTYKDFERIGHVRQFSLPGGEKSIKEPWRIAVSLLLESGLSTPEIFKILANIPEKDVDFVINQVDADINCPKTTSMGRLFDGISAILGVRSYVNYEGQAAIEMEALAVNNGINDNKLLNYNEVVYDYAQFIDNYLNSPDISKASFDFHESIANWVCSQSLSNHSTNLIALSGGVWQNRLLTNLTLSLLNNHDIKVITQNKLPTNDGGISFGQVVSAYHKIS